MAKKGKEGNLKSGRAYNRALHVLARMRRTNETLTAAAREEHIDPRTVKKYLRAELRGMANGEVQPTRTDGRTRCMLIPTGHGVAPTLIRGSKNASQLGRYMSAVGKFLVSGDTDPLEEFEGLSIAGHRLITDPDVLSTLAQAGALQLDQIYALPESSS